MPRKFWGNGKIGRCVKSAFCWLIWLTWAYGVMPCLPVERKVHSAYHSDLHRNATQDYRFVGGVILFGSRVCERESLPQQGELYKMLSSLKYVFWDIAAEFLRYILVNVTIELTVLTEHCLKGICSFFFYFFYGPCSASCNSGNVGLRHCLVTCVSASFEIWLCFPLCYWASFHGGPVSVGVRSRCRG